MDMNNKLFDIIKAREIAIDDLCKKANIGRTSFYMIAKGVQVPKLDTALRISRAIGVPIGEVFPDIKEGVENESKV